MRTLQRAWLIATLLLLATWSFAQAQTAQEIEEAWPNYTPVELDGRVLLMPPDYLTEHTNYVLTYSFLQDGNTLSQSSLFWDSESIGRTVTSNTTSGTIKIMEDGSRRSTLSLEYSSIVVGISDAVPKHDAYMREPGGLMPPAHREEAEELSIGGVSVLVYHPIADTFKAELHRQVIPAPKLADVEGELLPVVMLPDEPEFEKVGSVRVPLGCKNVGRGEGEQWEMPSLPANRYPNLRGSRLVPLMSPHGSLLLNTYERFRQRTNWDVEPLREYRDLAALAPDYHADQPYEIDMDYVDLYRVIVTAYAGDKLVHKSEMDLVVPFSGLALTSSTKLAESGEEYQQPLSVVYILSADPSADGEPLAPEVTAALESASVIQMGDLVFKTWIPHAERIKVRAWKARKMMLSYRQAGNVLYTEELFAPGANDEPAEREWEFYGEAVITTVAPVE